MNSKQNLLLSENLFQIECNQQKYPKHSSILFNWELRLKSYNQAWSFKKKKKKKMKNKQKLFTKNLKIKGVY